MKNIYEREIWRKIGCNILWEIQIYQEIQIEW